MTAKVLKLGLVGLGTVGSGVYETLLRNHDILEARAQIPFFIKRVAVRDLGRKRDVAVDPALLTDDWRDIVDDPEIDIVIELMGGITEARTLILAALNAGKPVVTGNKAVLAEYGCEIFQLSAEKGVPIYFEASCGGGIPIVQSLQNSLICNNVRSIAGIINGTSNYILTSIRRRGETLEEALRKAQELGYAEADPTTDINGWDAAYKALILAMLAYGTPLSPGSIDVRGLERIEPQDFTFARRLGFTIKLLLIIKHHEQENALELRVQPSFVPKNHLLASVDDAFNAIVVNGDIVGETIFYGRGAGKNPTASAVIGDVVLAMRDSLHPEFHAGFSPYAKKFKLLSIEETVTPYYVRFHVQDRPGVIAAIAAAFAEYGVGISGTASIPCGEDGDGVRWVSLVFMLHACSWGQLRKALRRTEMCDFTDCEPFVIRIETFND